MPDDIIVTNPSMRVTVLCEFCGVDIASLAVSRVQPTRDVKVGVLMAQIIEHLFTCEAKAPGEEAIIAIAPAEEYDDEGDDDEDDDD